MKKPKNRERLTLSITKEQVVRLREIAEANGCMWGADPNISELICQIADYKLSIGRFLPDGRLAIEREKLDRQRELIEELYSLNDEFLW